MTALQPSAGSNMLVVITNEEQGSNGDASARDSSNQTNVF